MATSDSIKIKSGNSTHTINLIKYKSGNTTKMINSVWYVKNGNKNLVWPKSYDATLRIEPTYNGNLNAIPAEGGTVNLKYYLTVYYPNTNIPVDPYNNLEVTNGATNWLSIKNNNTGIITVNPSGYTNKSEIRVEDRLRNGLPVYTGPDNQQDPYADGSWTYHIDANKQVTINTIPVTASSSLEFTQLENNFVWKSTSPTNIQLNFYNNKSGNIYNGVNTSSNPAPYTSGTIYGLISGTINIFYLFDSGQGYTVKHYPNEYEYNWNSDSSWASINSNTWNVTLSENTSTSPRKATISVTVSGERHTYDIWQAGAPDPNTTNP